MVSVAGAAADAGGAEGQADRGGPAEAGAALDDQVLAAVGVVLPALGAVHLATDAHPRERADGDVAGAGRLVAVAHAGAGAVRGDGHVQEVGVLLLVLVPDEPADVVTGVLHVAERLEAERVELVGAGAGAVGTPHGVAVGADQRVVQVQVGRDVEADRAGGGAPEGLAVGRQRALEVPAAHDARVDGEAGGGVLLDVLADVVLLGSEPSLLVGELGVGGLAGLALGGDLRLADLGLLQDGAAQDVVGDQQVVDDAVLVGVAALALGVPVFLARLPLEPLLLLGLDDLGGDLAGLLLPLGLGGAAVDGPAGGLEDVLGVLELGDRHELAHTVLADDLRVALEDVDEDDVVRQQDLEAAVHAVDLAGRGGGGGAGGAALVLDGEGRRVPVAAVLDGGEPGSLGLGHRQRVRGRGVAVVVQAVLVDLVDQGGLVGGAVVAVVLAGLDADVLVVDGAVAVDVHAGHVGPVTVRVDRGEVGGREGARAHQGQQAHAQDQGALHVFLQGRGKFSLPLSGSKGIVRASLPALTPPSNPDMGTAALVGCPAFFLT